jgi:sulfur carrier protein
MQITLNGQSHEVEAGSSVATLVKALQLSPRHVAVEVNLQLVPREAHAERSLAEGDRVEVVTLVGGG